MTALDPRKLCPIIVLKVANMTSKVNGEIYRD